MESLLNIRFPDELTTERLMLTRSRVTDAAELLALTEDNLAHLGRSLSRPPKCYRTHEDRLRPMPEPMKSPARR